MAISHTEMLLRLGAGAALGLATGAGMFLEAGIVTLISLIGLIVLRQFELKPPESVLRFITIVLDDSANREELLAELRAMKIEITNVDYATSAKLLKLH